MGIAIPRNITRLEGPVKIDIDEDLDGWNVFAYIGNRIVLNDTVASEAKAMSLADKYETQLRKKGFE